ncbi:BtpA/SgcQ family protein [Subtercola sp. RTI3]|uniref:BtpA/SgcQ family protein n=1 Tax=Subtercola sp. RTI3 TaxID=3048639 RepID=UPI002B23A93C|nr:BtpA/SgcQ family protein [Subtercola sp. RTI3]MEA9983961.1 BtpA/SgcQ family protein [Subtercola sp. RTI3]
MGAFRLVGVLHLPPLPGAANYAGAKVGELAEIAAVDARVLAESGFTDVMIQDASDNPQADRVGAATVAAMSVIGAAVRRAVTIPVGVVVGHNDGPSAVAIAHAIDAQFVRVKVLTGVSVGPTGFIEGCSHDVSLMKRMLGSAVEVWADAHEATSLALSGNTDWAAAEARSFGAADKIIVTRDSGVADAIDDIARLRAQFGSDAVDLLIGGRVTGATLAAAIAGSDGAILGSVLKTGSGHDARIDPVASRLLGEAVRDHAA